MSRTPTLRRPSPMIARSVTISAVLMRTRSCARASSTIVPWSHSLWLLLPFFCSVHSPPITRLHRFSRARRELHVHAANTFHRPGFRTFRVDASRVARGTFPPRRAAAQAGRPPTATLRRRRAQLARSPCRRPRAPPPTQARVLPVSAPPHAGGASTSQRFVITWPSSSRERSKLSRQRHQRHVRRDGASAPRASSPDSTVAARHVFDRHALRELARSPFCRVYARWNAPPRGVTVFADRCGETGAARAQKRRRHCPPALACGVGRL